jgi:23S rRNA (guanosine2251-2'-O)-methyltransferase
MEAEGEASFMRLFGKRSVTERLRRRPVSVRTVYVVEGVNANNLLGITVPRSIPIRQLPEKRFRHISGNAQSQGVIADVEEYQYADFDELITEHRTKPVLVFLDRITDPQNLGAILRSVACFGGFAVVLPKHESVPVNETVLKVACGGENYVPVAQVANLSIAIDKAKKQGYSIGATVVTGGKSLSSVPLSFPLGLVFGSEGEGIRPVLMKHVDYAVTLPMQGAALSFNVAIAVSILSYEAYCQRQTKTESFRNT